jgi:ribonuclease R
MKHRRFNPSKKHGKFSPNRPQPGPRSGPPGPRPSKPVEVFTEGRLQLRGKFGFVLSEEPGLSDVYVDGQSLRLAMDGDRVLARVTSPGGTARRAGEIVRVLARARDTVVGAFARERGSERVLPETGAEPIQILDKKGLSPQEGQLVVVKITSWPTAAQGSAGHLTEVLGWRQDAGVDITAVVRKFELPQDFPRDAAAEAESWGSEVPDSALRGRTTFFHLPVFTIDGAHAKDFDDAVSLELLPNGGARLGVHIADVAHYVKEGGALDEEALERATSVYLADRVIPMLPPSLSDNLCSLRPDQLRLTLSCVMDLDASGNVVSSQLLESAIRSARRFTYEEVQAILEGKSAGSDRPEVADAVRRMGALARRLRARRMERGSLDFDFPEAEVTLDEAGRPVDILRRARLESHQLVEEFMLLANETVATAMKRFPFLYRVHDRPDPTKLAKLKETLQAVGVSVPPKFDEGLSTVLQKVLRSVHDQPVEPMVHMMILRSLKQAVYSTQNVGHFGLASACYTHFTSPIRRYPDLCVHRVVKEYLQGQLTPERQVHWKRALPGAADRSSQRERLAQEAEREVLELKRVQFMEKRVGESFDGVISGVTAFGFFVQLIDVFVEGLVHINNLHDDYYIFDDVRVLLRGRRTQTTFRMGQRVRVRLAGVNVVKRQLDFELERETAPGPARKR